jgi:hypothetical protein
MPELDGNGRTVPPPAWKVEIVKKHVDKLDPIGLLAGGAPPDHYTRECIDIAERIRDGMGAVKIQTIMFVVFAYMFDVDEALPVAKYGPAAVAIQAEIANWHKREM